MEDPNKPWSPVPLAICEACSFIYGITLIVGTTYLTGWVGWSGWTWVGCVLLLASWSCKWCRYPGTAEEDKQ